MCELTSPGVTNICAASMTFVSWPTHSPASSPSAPMAAMLSPATATLTFSSSRRCGSIVSRNLAFFR